MRYRYLIMASMFVHVMYGMEQVNNAAHDQRTRIEKVADTVVWVIDSQVVNTAAKLGGLAVFMVMLQMMIDMRSYPKYIEKNEVGFLSAKIDTLHGYINAYWPYR